MDNLKDHWYKSIFNKYNPDFWNPEISWKKGFVKGTDYHMDAWHIFKSSMIISLVLAIVLYSPIICPIVDFMIYGAIWNLSFNIFYNHILNKVNNKT